MRHSWHCYSRICHIPLWVENSSAQYAVWLLFVSYKQTMKMCIWIKKTLKRMNANIYYNQIWLLESYSNWWANDSLWIATSDMNYIPGFFCNAWGYTASLESDAFLGYMHTKRHIAIKTKSVITCCFVPIYVRPMLKERRWILDWNKKARTQAWTA